MAISPKISFILNIALIILFGCYLLILEKEDNCNRLVEYKEKYDKLNYFKVDIKEWRKEYLPIDSMRVFKNGDEVHFLGPRIDFTTKTETEVSFPMITLSRATSIYDVAQLFPESSRLNRKSGYAFRGTIKVFCREGEVDRDFWILEFRGEVLKRMQLYRMQTREEIDKEEIRHYIPSPFLTG